MYITKYIVLYTTIKTYNLVKFHWIIPTCSHSAKSYMYIISSNSHSNPMIMWILFFSSLWMEKTEVLGKEWRPQVSQ